MTAVLITGPQLWLSNPLQAGDKLQGRGGQQKDRFTMSIHTLVAKGKKIQLR